MYSSCCGEGGQTINAEFNFPRDLVFDVSGDFYSADTDNNRIREINAAGVINTIAGSASYTGYSGTQVPLAQQR